MPEYRTEIEILEDKIKELKECLKRISRLEEDLCIERHDDDTRTDVFASEIAEQALNV